MTDKEGILRMMASGRWALYRPGRFPAEITSGEVFRVEVAGVEGPAADVHEIRPRRPQILLDRRLSAA
jgi:hypothetical protein